MKLKGVELIHARLPLVSPFRTSLGTDSLREAILVRVVTDISEGWGECVAFGRPFYSSEYADAAAAVLRDYLVPALAASASLDPAGVAPTLSWIRGHRMAKAALELAVLDADLRSRGVSLGAELGAVHERIPCGVSVGIADSIPELLDVVEGHLAAGYKRVKLKIEPGWDVAPVTAVRERFGDALPLQVDANTAYSLADAPLLAQLDPLGLLLIEQPLDEDDLLGHAELARLITTPVCLDESITSAAMAEAAIRMGACSIVNIKAGRVGGYLEAVRVHDVCVARGIPVWCGGMLESGIGRAANVALAALPGFTLPGDNSASARFYEHDLTEPFVMIDGELAVPTGPGLGVTPIPAALDEVATRREWLRLA